MEGKSLQIKRWADKNVAVVGLGISGLAVCRTLRDSGAHVVAWDDNQQVRKEARQEGITISQLDRLDNLDGLFLGPGIALNYPDPHPVVLQARQDQCPIFGDVELLAQAYDQDRPSFIGITGTNGKSTTTALIHHMMATCGLSAHMGGNIGIPVASLPYLAKDQHYVLEMSSFQLDLLSDEMGFDIAILLNIARDHIERHGDFDGLVKAKARILTRVKVAIIALDDPATRDIYAKLAKARPSDQPIHLIPVSSKGPVEGGILVQDGQVYDHSQADNHRVFRINNQFLVGQHNGQNAGVAYACGRALGLKSEAIIAAFKTFTGLDHRQQLVGTWRKLSIINDSKATNFAAVRQALINHDVVFWLAGGRLKDDDFAVLDDVIDRVHHAFFFGEAADIFAQHYHGQLDYQRFDTLAMATDAALNAASSCHKKCAVVLSPACASFDQFGSFGLRGSAFSQQARAWLSAKAQ